MKSLLRIVLAAAFVHLAPAFAQAPKKVVASPALQKEFDDFIKKFRAAVKANDSAAVAGMTRLPFEADGSIRDATEFRAKTYPLNFTAKNRACIQRGKATYARDGENNDNYFIFCGQLIFVFTKTPAGFLLTDIGANDWSGGRAVHRCPAVVLIGRWSRAPACDIPVAVGWPGRPVD